jgi:hypothetical protein
VEGFCEHGNEPSGSIKFEWLHSWRLLSYMSKQGQIYVFSIKWQLCNKANGADLRITTPMTIFVTDFDNWLHSLWQSCEKVDIFLTARGLEGRRLGFGYNK